MLQRNHLDIEQGHGCPVDIAQGEDISCINHQCRHQALLDFSDSAHQGSLISSWDERHTTVLVRWSKHTARSLYALGCPIVVVMDLFVVHLRCTVFHDLAP